MPPDARPLSGVRVIDLGWITAGAGTSTMLADLGAEVIKIEGPGAPDPFREWESAANDADWWNRSPFFASTNHDKRSLCLDLKADPGRAVLFRLLEGADVLVENFRRGVLASFGLDPATLRERFPRLVVAAISSQGETGPDRDMVSYGSTLEATAGLAALTGAGDKPVITGRDVNYPDQVVCLFAPGAIIAALLERERTGRGAHLDLSQRELTTFLIGEEVLAAAAGAPTVRRGNHDPLHPQEKIVRDGADWLVVNGATRTPVRDAAALIEAPEFKNGTAIGVTLDGRPAKGIPFRFGKRRLAVRQGCRPLGADNAAVLAEIGYSERDIADLQASGVIATAPRRKNTV
ncbi:CaiB/BaiF CoA-transferase family protein [Methylocapsa sp. S129]|uniref:CaiB/BaiF CoA transferase family protein n=1 Tax=Methylocapsa sp. S129 TaxID=1641869 RepID=UPI00131AF78F|nr:CaiB/BaiF CoA-transferase family protein [Methylocapsa sp. S129]